MRAAIVGLLLLTGGLAGCLGDERASSPGSNATPGSDAPGADGPTLPPGTSMAGGEVLSRTPSQVTYRWTTPAPASAAGVGPDGRPPTVETTFDVPASRAILLSANATIEGDGDPLDASGIELLLLRGNEPLCHEEAGIPHPSQGTYLIFRAQATCELPPIAPLAADETWTLRVVFNTTNPPGNEVLAHLAMAAIEPPNLAALGELLPFETEAPDGTPLRGHVYVPEGDGPFPTVLHYSPYWNTFYPQSEGASEPEGNRTSVSHAHGPFNAGIFLEHGYAVALVNIRGTGESEGCNAWFDPEIDGPDAAAVIRALSEMPWSNGKVGMTGVSWPGYTQYAALKDAPAGLEAIAPMSSILDPWTLHTRRGPTTNFRPFGPPASTYAGDHAITTVGLQGDTDASHLTCPTYAEHVKALLELSLDGDKTAFWQERTLHDELRQSDVPVFVTNGLTNGEGHILQIDGLWDVLPTGSRMLIGQWPHGPPTATPGEGSYWELALAWFDHHLKGRPSTLDAGVVDYQDDAGSWHRADSWPPVSKRTRLHLSAGELVTNASAVQASEQTFQAADTDPRVNGCTVNKAVYVSEPLAEDVLIAGNAQVNLTLTSTAPNSNLGVFIWRLEELPPCTRAADEEVTFGVYPHETARALSDLRHRGHMEQGEPFPIGTPEGVALTSHPFASRVQAGQRLVVVVNGGTAEELSPKDEDPVLTVHTGDGLEAYVDLPVVEGQLAFESAKRGSSPIASPLEARRSR